ncbi:MAG TPA: SEC-C metal-binding domain-containing protein [Myxococcales bacterium]|nr:SEC-C metal-binding domain-containing protein [Myxococcales bacterium]
MRPTERKAPCPCGSGRKYKNCCYTRDRAEEAPREAARAGLRQVDELLRVFLPLLESRGEYKIACGSGCNACCNNFVRCSLPEALLVADWLQLPENAAVLARFREKLPAWRDCAGPTARELEEILEKSGGTQPEGAEWERFKTIGQEYALRGNLCPFNEEGRCEIYPVRPTICRSVHVLETSHYCTPGRGQHPKVVSHPKLEEVVQEATTTFGRAAVALTGSSRERALPESVAWALDRRR